MYKILEKFYKHAAYFTYFIFIVNKGETKHSKAINRHFKVYIKAFSYYKKFTTILMRMQQNPQTLIYFI